MPRDSNGNASTDPVYVATPGTTIRAVQHNTPIADIIQMLTGSLARNGTGGMLADLPMGGFKITGLANGASAQDAVTKAQLDATLGGLPQLGAWTNVASASTVNLGEQASRNLVITGTTTITSFGTAGAADNVPYLVRFAGALTLTNSASLILPGAANITTAAGDVAIVVHDTASVWRVIAYNRAAMPPLVFGTAANNLVALDANGKLPAVDGSQLLGLSAVDPGIIGYTAEPNPPAGWLERNGAAISRTAYAALFARIGTIFGAGDGSTTFNLPDARGTFDRGWDHGRGVDPGRTFGSYQSDQLGSHTHTLPNTSSSGSGGALDTKAFSASNDWNTGSTGGTETRPKNIAYLPIIKY